MSSAKKNMIVLKSSDGESFEVEESVALESQTIKHMIEDVSSADGSTDVPIPNVTGRILAKVIEYCKRHVDGAASNKSSSEVGSGAEKSDKSTTTAADLNAFDTDFVKVDQTTLFELILAANYLDIKSLLDLTCQSVANLIKDMTVEEVRKIFNIQNDFTPEEEEAVRKENAWAFE